MRPASIKLWNDITLFLFRYSLTVFFFFMLGSLRNFTNRSLSLLQYACQTFSFIGLAAALITLALQIYKAQKKQQYALRPILILSVIIFFFGFFIIFIDVVRILLQNIQL